LEEGREDENCTWQKPGKSTTLSRMQERGKEEDCMAEGREKDDFIWQSAGFTRTVK